MNDLAPDLPSITIEFTEKFKNDIRVLSKRYRNIKKNLEEGVLSEIKIGSFLGTNIDCVFNYMVYKARCKNTDAARGKRGGYRLIYCVFFLEKSAEVFLLTVYSKSDREDISAKEIKEIIEEHIPVPALIPAPTPSPTPKFK